MPVSPEYREFVLEQLGRVAPVTVRSMFGGAGIYADGMIFALIAGDTVYLKVDDVNRPDFQAAGMGPFNPFGDDKHVMQYYELPAELLEDPDRLRPWMFAAIDVARRSRMRTKKK
jgi:DNA transformation protein